MPGRASVIVMVKTKSNRVHLYGPFDSLKDAEDTVSAFDGTHGEVRALSLGLAWDAASKNSRKD